MAAICLFSVKHERDACTYNAPYKRQHTSLTKHYRGRRILSNNCYTHATNRK